MGGNATFAEGYPSDAAAVRDARAFFTAEGYHVESVNAAFQAARELGALLFFDEADSLLSKRVSTDKSCSTSINQNRNCPMQELDRLDRVVIVNTNLFEN